MKREMIFPLLLCGVAVIAGIAGFIQDSFSLGVTAVFFLWWADSERKRITTR